jgi:thiol-disulfide isomerase/thioredoxin
LRYVRAFALIAVLVGAACDREGATPSPDVSGYRGLPEWAAVPAVSREIAHPRAWLPDGRPTLLLFTASWCPSCPASLGTDLALARRYGDRLQVGIGLVEESDEDWSRSAMAALVGDVPVWSAGSVDELAARCDARAIPIACLVDGDRVVYRGHGASAAHVIDAYLAGRLRATRAADAAARARVAALLALGWDGADVDDIVAATHHDPAWQSELAWSLVSPLDASPTAISLGLALARDMVASEGGLDYGHLDTFAVALSKANLPEDAALVSWRMLAVCSAVHAKCIVERRRAAGYIYYARETGRRWR